MLDGRHAPTVIKCCVAANFRGVPTVDIKGIIATGRRGRQRQQRGARPSRAVGEHHLVDTAGRRQQLAAQRDLVDGAGDAQHQIAGAGFLDAHLGGRDPCSELQRVDLAAAGAVVEDGVLAIAGIEHIGVAAKPALQRVVAKTTGQGVVAGLAVDRVVARRAGQRVVA